MSAPQATTGFGSHCMGGMEKQGGELGMWKKVERTPLGFLNVNAPIYAEYFIPG